MFQSARVKLTAWYLLIIMCISIVFSLVIYNGINREFERFERVEIFRVYSERVLFRQIPSSESPTMIEEARSRLTLTLILINLGILGLSGIAGYFLAGRTLRPIAKMMDEQNRFITDASHELRTPITALKTSLEVNLREKNLSAGEVRELLKSNLEEVDNLQGLSDDLILLAQSQKFDRSLFAMENIQEIVKQAAKRVEPLAKKKDIAIRLHLLDSTLEADRKSLTELFVILLDNAIKYSPKNSKITITNKEHDGQIILSVEDQGVGIDEKDVPFIFDRFYRAEKSRTKNAVFGYGLGLSIARKIVDIHRGDITVKSKKNKGTAFTIRLPQKQSSSVFSKIS